MRAYGAAHPRDLPEYTLEGTWGHEIITRRRYEVMPAAQVLRVWEEAAAARMLGATPATVKAT